MFAGPHMLLPADKARHVGEAVAMVVAETRAQAMDAAEMVEVEYEVLPLVIHSEDALAPDAPAVWDEVRDNVLVDSKFGDQAKTDRAFAAAAHVVKATSTSPASPACRWSCARRSATSTRRPAAHALRRLRRRGSAKDRDGRVLGIAPDKLRVLSFDVGGNFGTRNRPYVEFGLVLWAARRLNAR